MKLIRRKPTRKLLDSVSKEIHWYISYATLSTYYTMLKACRTDIEEDERDKAADLLNKMITTSSQLYDDLNDEQKELMDELALKMIEICRKL